MKKCMLMILVGLIGFCLGCEKQVQMEETMPVCIDSDSMDHLFSAAESVLTGMQFQIDKSDRQARQIITRPLRGGQFFEFWRSDNATGADVAESSLHSIQRIAEVRFDWADGMACANCRVYVRRLSMPDQPIGAGDASAMFTESSSHLQTLQLQPGVEEQIEWIHFGNDPALEQVILQKIQKAAQRGGQR